MSKRLLRGRKLPGTGRDEYELVVEHYFFGLFRRIQVYRGHILWTTYPQGFAYWGDTEWLDAQCQQFEWSQESAHE
jgi:hypothetical protein